jgi:hypothetical protein
MKQKLIIFIIILILVLIIYLKYNNNEHFWFYDWTYPYPLYGKGYDPLLCRNCESRSVDSCFGCRNCGVCTDKNGVRSCATGTASGPMFRNDCVKWEYDHNFYYPYLYPYLYPVEYPYFYNTYYPSYSINRPSSHTTTTVVKTIKPKRIINKQIHNRPARVIKKHFIRPTSKLF